MEVELPILSPAFSHAYLDVGPYESYRLEGRMDPNTFQQQTAAISSFITANCPRKSTLIICNIVFGLATLALIIVSIMVFWIPSFNNDYYYTPPSIIIYFIPLIVIVAFSIITVILNSWYAIKLGQLDRSLQKYLHSVNVAIAQSTSLRFQLRIATNPNRSCVGFTDPYVMNTLRARYSRGWSQYWVITLNGPNQLNVVNYDVQSYYPGTPGSQGPPVNPGYYYPPSFVDPANQGYHPPPVTYQIGPPSYTK